MERTMRNTCMLRMSACGVSLALLLAPATSPEPTAGSGQQPGILVPVSAGFVPGVEATPEGGGTTLIEEGGDIGEGLSNQRSDPDD